MCPLSATNSGPVVPPHGRRLGIVGVSLTKARLPKDSGAVLEEVRDEFESLLDATGYLKDAPFSWVTVALRYGLRLCENALDEVSGAAVSTAAPVRQRVEFGVKGLRPMSSSLPSAAQRRGS